MQGKSTPPSFLSGLFRMLAGLLVACFAIFITLLIISSIAGAIAAVMGLFVAFSVLAMVAVAIGGLIALFRVIYRAFSGDKEPPYMHRD